MDSELIIVSRYIGDNVRHYVIKSTDGKSTFVGKIELEGSILAQANSFPEGETIIKNLKEKEKKK